jgi:hypothetical protein
MNIDALNEEPVLKPTDPIASLQNDQNGRNKQPQRRIVTCSNCGKTGHSTKYCTQPAPDYKTASLPKSNFRKVKTLEGIDTSNVTVSVFLAIKACFLCAQLVFYAADCRSSSAAMVLSTSMNRPPLV